MTDTSQLQSEKAYLYAERAGTLRELSFYKQYGPDSSISSLEENLLRLEVRIAEMEQRIADEMSRQ